ncbi:MAG: lytic transglycosylase [Flavobacteriia bacterium]|nr:MAG: lytic transglycosylase [Flavobacteriia bacterium]
MKKILQLIFLLLTYSSFAQNSEEIQSIDNFYIPVYKDFLAKQSIVDKDYANLIDFKWLQTQITSSESKSVEVNITDFDTFLLIKQLKDLNNKTLFQIEHNPTLERYIRVFLRSRKETLAHLMERSRYYFPLFEKYLDKYDLPLEIKYLAVIESALKPQSKSKTGARGLWQFTYATGKHFGLEINSMVDERYDPVKSTEAACKFLNKLYKMFGNWDLALAAYNSGPGNVTKAIRRAGGNKNYWEIRKYLPLETRGYLPAFYATFYLFEYNIFHNIKPKKTGLSYFETDTVKIKKQVSINKIASVLGLNNEFLKILNPQYKTGVIPYKSVDPYALVLPKNKISDFIRFEEKIYSDKPARQTSKIIKVSPYNSYKVKKGDNLSRIASKFNIRLEQLKMWNGLETNYLIEGQHLVISDKNNFHKLSLNKNKEREIKTYIVQKGGSLFIISRKFPDVSVNQLKEWNNLHSENNLEPGIKLIIKKS